MPSLRSHYLGIFIIALAGLAYQVVLTRIFSVVLYYHSTFVGVSFAMLGITIGAERVFLQPGRFAPERLSREWAKAALGFAVTGILFVFWFLYIPLFLPKSLLGMLVSMSMFLFVIPFTYSGICVTLLLTKSTAPVGRLYAADLVGAALGSLGIVGLLFVLDPITVMLAICAACAAVACLFARGQGARLSASARVIALVLCVACLAQGASYLSGGSHLRVIWAKSAFQNNILFERWNAFSRIRVVPLNSYPPFGWAFGHRQEATIEQKFLDIDADAGTVLTRFNGDRNTISFLGNDLINIGYHIRPIRETAVIGVGGGRDLLSALYFGANVTGIELNPAILEALRGPFYEFTGHLVDLPGVTVVNAEARSWLAQQTKRFDLVQISLIDTWAATAAGGLTLSENKLYTVDAWKEFLSRLNPNGMLVVSRWFHPVAHPGEFYRLLSIAAETLKERDVPAEEIRRHVLAFNAGSIVTVAVSPSVFTDAELSHLDTVMREENFTPMQLPDSTWDQVSAVIASGKADDAFFSQLPLDVRPSTDDRPFFFFMVHPGDMLKVKHTQDLGTVQQATTSAGPLVGYLIIGMAVCVLIFVVLPLTREFSGSWRGLAVQGFAWHMAWFAFIGFGFMLIEISQMQRLMILLGHPMYGLSVVLFTLLLFGGIGSATVSAERVVLRPFLRPFCLCVVLLLTGFATPLVTHALVAEGIIVRILASVALLAPAACFMGMMFPLGMALSRRHGALLPWFWGMNGATSVFASVLGMGLSMMFGISVAFWTGFAAYLLCLALIPRLCEERTA